MFEDYSVAVLAAYRELKVAGALSANLNPLTRVGLKKACAATLQERYRKEDSQVLKDFFGFRETRTDYMKAIEICTAEKFKALHNFLKGESDSTGATNVELLAWLIDFQPRPYKTGETYGKVPVGPGKPQELPEKLDAQAELGETVTVTTIRPTPLSDQTKKKKKQLVVMMSMLIVLVLVLAVVKYQNRKTIAPTPPLKSLSAGSPAGCMYWVGENYKTIPCSQKKGDTQVVALDTFRLAHFRKITRPDTITVRSLRKVFYFKSGNGLEYFTTDGFHPIYPDRALKPLTEHMLFKYILHYQ